MLVVGIDENGLGPILGPLVVTASLVEAKDPERLSKGSLKESKKICGFGRMKECERIVLSFYKLLYNSIPSNTLEFLSNILIQKDRCSLPFLHCICDLQIPSWMNSGINNQIAQNYLQEIDASIKEIKSIAICPGKFNQRLKYVSGKLHLNYLLFEDLFSYFKENYKDEILFLCGRNGRTKNYQKFFNLFSPIFNYETKDEIGYYFCDGQKVRFITDGDARYFPITISSIFGKYIRELFIRRMNEFFKSKIPALLYCSGYRDKKTRQFIKETADLRNELNIPEECFLRER
ncbi:MAG: hypothetical protein NC912_02000 [Candidatus Omnitrophica bacterium]|nr:hypothetical protein [Candidatus Omnitrophota bacterium]